ncbi:MAG: cytochrome P450 [Pseudomonadota bacterium]
MSPQPIPLATAAGELPDGAGTHEILAYLAKVAACGDIAAFALGDTRCILVNGAAARTLFRRHEADLAKPEFVKASNRGHWGDGLTTLEGGAWRARRRALLPSMRARQVAPRLTVMADLTAEMLAGWRPGPIALGRHMRILTARIAAWLVIDAELEGYGTGEGRSGVIAMPEAYGEDYATATADDEAGVVMVRPRAPADMAGVCRIIDRRIASGQARGDVLSDIVALRLEDGSRLSRDEIVGETIQMMYAGHLTIPATLERYWRAIAAIDTASLHAEADAAPARPDPQALMRSRTMAALREAMRLDPVAPVLYREVARPFALEGYAFQPGDQVWVSPALLHRDRRLHHAPDTFDPGRFLAGRDAQARAAFIPFGAGPRTCIAAQQSLLQMTLIAQMTARAFTLTPSEQAPGRFLLHARTEQRAACE